MARKKLHTLKNCKICSTFHAPISSLFPESKNYKSKKASPLTNALIKTGNTIPIKAKPTNAEILEVGEMIFSELDKTCKENMGTSLRDILIKTPEANLQEKMSSMDKKKDFRKLQRSFKTTMEDIWEKMMWKVT